MPPARGRIISLRLTDDEYDRLAKEAEAENVTVSVHLRSTVFDHRIPSTTDVLYDLIKMHTSDQHLDHGVGTKLESECALCGGVRELQEWLVSGATIAP